MKEHRSVQPDRIEARTQLPTAASQSAAAERVLAMQRTAGNRAVAKLLRVPVPQVGSEAASADFALALKYVDDFYEGVRDVLELKDKVRAQAINDYQTFGKLKDPPQLADAIVAAIFSEVVGMIPGGDIVKAGLTAGLFARDMAGLKKELDANPILALGTSVEAEKKKGPSDERKKQAEKAVGAGKAAVGMGKAVVGAVQDTRQKQAEAAAAEADAKAIAGLHSGRISDWAVAISNTQRQEQQVVTWLTAAQQSGRGRGAMDALVRARLGPIPTVSDALSRKLSAEYELALYREKHRGALGITSITVWEDFDIPDTVGHSIELEGGGKMSDALIRRIATLVGEPGAGPQRIATVLRLRHEERKKISRRPAGAREY